jgi:hypothetical protein
MIEKNGSKEEWLVHVAEMREKGRHQIAELMMAPSGIRTFDAGGVRYKSPFAGAYLKRDMAAPVTASASPARRVSPAPAPVSAPAADRTTVSRAPEADLIARIARAIALEDSEDDDDDGNPPPMAAAYAVAADIDDDAMARVKKQWPGANNEVFLREKCEALISAEKHARAVALQRQYEDEAIAKNRELSIFGGRFTKSGDDALAFRIEKQNSIADMIDDALDEREGI